MTQSSERLETLERLVVERTGDGHDGVTAIIAAARVEASTVLSADLDPAAEADLCEHVFCVAALAGLAAAGTLEPDLGQALTAPAGGPERQLARALAAIDHPSLTALPIDSAASAQCRLLICLAPITALAIWRVDANGTPAPSFRAGSRRLPREARTLATRVLDGQTTPLRGVDATPIRAQGGVVAALVWRTDTAGPGARVLAERAAAALAAPFQQALAVQQNVAGMEALVQQPERRLRRLALDLHDGALQDVALIAGELRRLEDDLRPIVFGTDRAEEVRQALEGLAALVDALDGDLREVATSVEGPGMLRRPFDEAIAAIVRVFRARSPIATSVDVQGDAEGTTDSQRIAVFRIVQESLTNVQKHSKASHVSVAVRMGDDELIAEISDDGIGFDAPNALDIAAANQRIGLLGMVERIRLLGGRCDIDSQPGKGTKVRVWLPSYTLPATETGPPIDLDV